MRRWSSDIYEIYCRMSEQSALRVGTLLASARVQPLAPAFHEEHLELLPAEVDELGRAFCIDLIEDGLELGELGDVLDEDVWGASC
eukprot:1264549-Prymnesium_polylepis.1